uniref:Uncharacterized protein n=1 Tax=Romanomermis culicivorax TaxID=13658 RepID=A0A915KA62_ROMCU
MIDAARSQRKHHRHGGQTLTSSSTPVFVVRIYVAALKRNVYPFFGRFILEIFQRYSSTETNAYRLTLLQFRHISTESNKN